MKKTFTIILCCILSNCYTQTLPNYVPKNGLVAWYPFNGNTNDESGNGNNGINKGATLTEDRCNNINGAYSFNGINNRIDLPLNLNNKLLNLKEFSFSCYVKNSNGGGIFSNWKAFPLTDPFGILISTSNNTFDATTNSGTSVRVKPISFQQWTHIAVVFDGNKNGALNKMKLYINGVMMNTDSSSLVYSSTVISNNLGNTATNTCIGAWFSQFGWIGYFKGIIDDIGIWDRVLTQTEISSLCFFNCCKITPITNNFNHTGCNKINYLGVDYFSSIILKDTIKNLQGCDSSYNTHNIIINKSTTHTQQISSFSPYIWNGVAYTTSGVYLYKTLNKVECDSIVTLDLTIKQLTIIDSINLPIIPNVFSPNGDGINDYWDLSIIENYKFNFIIFDRYGMVVFKGNDINNKWNGYRNGQPLGIGTYFYIIDIINQKRINGSVTILR